MEEIFDSEEIEIEEALEKAKTAVGKFGIVKNLYEQKFGEDFPKFKIINSQISKIALFSDGLEVDPIGCGTSNNKDLAMLKSLSESFERYAGMIYKNQNFIKGSYSQLREKALDPVEVAAFTKSQLRQKDFERFRFDENTQFNWTEGTSLISGKKILVPAQLVYWNYKLNGELTIHFGLSTGVAGGTSYAGATLRGIYEVVERDSFMIAWLNKLPLKEVDLSHTEDSQIEELTNELKKYKLELHVFDSSTDVRIHSFIGILIDKNINRPIMNCGLSAGLNPEKTIITTINEAFHGMPWRHEKLSKIGNKKIKPESIVSFDDRTVYWYQKGKLKELNFLLRSRNKIKISDLENYSTGSCIKDLQFIREELKEKNLETIVVDITPRDIKEIGFKEVKVLIPKMQPLYLIEKYRYLGGTRLYQIPEFLGFKRKKEEELNKIPHPFL